MNLKKIKMWKVILGTLALLSIPSLFVFSLERYTTSDEDFCMTCHYKMWGKDFLVHSEVHPDAVRCPACHADPGDLIPKDFSAHPERINPNCLRCHADMEQKVDTEGFKFNVMNIRIPHALHLQEAGASCNDCHFNIKHDKFRPVTNRPRMEVCFECHDQETTPCSMCHPRGAAEVLAVLPRSEDLDRDVCVTCHGEFETQRITFYGTAFLHETHLEQQLPCRECHSNATLHGQILKTRQECMVCHHQVGNRGCTACHGFEERFRNGAALQGVVGSPDVMADTVACEDCHGEMTGEHSRDNLLSSCLGCHEEADFSEQVDTAQERSEKAVRQLKGLLEESKRVAAGLPEGLRSDAEPRIVKSEKILATLEQDRSRGFHNGAYSSLLAEEAEAALGEVISMAEGAVQP